MSETQVGPIMAFTSRRREVAAFYRDLAGIAGDDGDDSTWLDAANARFSIHDPGDAQTPREIWSQTAFVVWFAVRDVRAAFDRAKRAGTAASDFYGDYFFARDPDGRYVGICPLEDPHGHDHEH